MQIKAVVRFVKNQAGLMQMSQEQRTWYDVARAIEQEFGVSVPSNETLYNETINSIIHRDKKD